MTNTPSALLVGDAPSPFMLIHNHVDIWQVVPANQPGDAKLIRTIRRGLDRTTNLRVTGSVSTQALTPSDNGSTLEVSGKGLFQLVLAWAAGFHIRDDVRLSRILTEQMGLPAAEEWMNGTLAYLARDHSNLLEGDVLRERVDEFGRYQAREEWRVNDDFWRMVLAG